MPIPRTKGCHSAADFGVATFFASVFSRERVEIEAIMTVVCDQGVANRWSEAGGLSCRDVNWGVRHA